MTFMKFLCVWRKGALTAQGRVGHIWEDLGESSPVTLETGLGKLCVNGAQGRHFLGISWVELCPSVPRPSPVPHAARVPSIPCSLESPQRAKDPGSLAPGWVGAATGASQSGTGRSLLRTSVFLWRGGGRWAVDINVDGQPRPWPRIPTKLNGPHPPVP